MGRYRGKNRQGGRGGRGGRGGQNSGGWRDYPPLVKENEKFQRFYDTLLALPETEKAEFWEAYRRELPNSFRFAGSKGHALAVKRLLKERYIPEIVKIEHQDGSPVEPPTSVPWYPDELAWWMTTPKNVVRKFPPFAAFQKFLVSETSVGNISRQEVVSMIPPMLMDLRPGMTVLDMCAAPGSKSAQLLEMIHVGEEARTRQVLRRIAESDGLDLGQETTEEKEADLSVDPSDDGRATGLLIANDSDYKRGHMLVHQLKRLSSPNLIVTNHDATQFPSIKLPSDDPSSKKTKYLKFDRILADVPCSGDGTLRKNVNLWKDWQPGSALGLHALQIRILVRALQLLKVGGRVVYSTCSMNPVENEAVIAAGIDRCGGSDSIEIIDCKNHFPGLKRRDGMKSWSIMDKSARIWNSWNEVEEFAKEQKDGLVPGRVVETMFPRQPGIEGADIPLDRCMRVYPHFQDTGGFFITVLEKRKDFRAKDENEAKQKPSQEQGNDTTDAPPSEIKPEVTGVRTTTAEKVETAAQIKEEKGTAEDLVLDDAPSVASKRPLDVDEPEEPESKKLKTENPAVTTPSTAPTPAAKPKTLKPGHNNEEPFKYLDPSHPTIQNIKQFYHLSTRFPDDRYMVRNESGEPAKAIYYTSALLRDIFTENEGRGIKFIHGGVRMYMKQDAPSAEVCRWRIQSEGMPILQGYVGEPRVIRLQSKETFHKLLIEMFPRVGGDAWQRFNEIGKRIREIGMGCCVLKIEPKGDDPDFSERMALPLWKSLQSLNLMLPKEDRAAMLLRIYNDLSPLINMPVQNQKGNQQGKKEQESGGKDDEGGANGKFMIVDEDEDAEAEAGTDTAPTDLDDGVAA